MKIYNPKMILGVFLSTTCISFTHPKHVIIDSYYWKTDNMDNE